MPVSLGKILSFQILAMTISCRLISGDSIPASEIAPAETAESLDAQQIVALGPHALKLFEGAEPELRDLYRQQLELQKYFADEGVTKTAPLSDYLLELGTKEQCYDHQNLSADTPLERLHLRQQLSAAAELIRDYHFDLLGQNGGPLSWKLIYLCPEEALGSMMIWEQGSLRIGVKSYASGYEILSARQLRAAWQAGEALGFGNQQRGLAFELRPRFIDDRQRQRALRFLWAQVQPWSAPRTDMRRRIHRHAMDVALALDASIEAWRSKRKSTFDQSLPTDGLSSSTLSQAIKNSMQEHLSPLEFSPLWQGSGLGERLLQWIKGADVYAFEDLLQRWRQQNESAQLRQEIEWMMVSWALEAEAFWAQSETGDSDFINAWKELLDSPRIQAMLSFLESRSLLPKPGFKHYIRIASPELRASDETWPAQNAAVDIAVDIFEHAPEAHQMVALERALKSFLQSH